MHKQSIDRGSQGFPLIRLFFKILSIPTVLILLVFSIRRILFTLVTLFDQGQPRRAKIGMIKSAHQPDVLILAPCRNEQEMVSGLCDSINSLDYPKEKIQVVLINDGSHDRTGVLMERCAASKPGWHAFTLHTNLGKASALNAALAQFPFGEIIYILDADHRPRPDALRLAGIYFDDPRVGGVSGRTLPVNPLASPSAYYSTVENYVHQMITMRAKDRLQLAPALLGSNCAYRRKALEQCGGFRGGALLEDSDLTLAFYRAGWQVRFAEDAIATHQVPQDIRNYFKQHARWARGFNDVALDHAPGLWHDKRISLFLRSELFLFSAGYLDRIALAGAAFLTIISTVDRRLPRFPRKVLWLTLLVPFLQIIALFYEQRLPRAMWLRLPLVPVFFVVDIAASAWAFISSISRRKTQWSQTTRIMPLRNQ